MSAYDAVYVLYCLDSLARSFAPAGPAGLKKHGKHETGKSANPADPGPDKIRPYLMKNKMTARIVRF